MRQHAESSRWFWLIFKRLAEMQAFFFPGKCSGCFYNSALEMRYFTSLFCAATILCRLPGQEQRYSWNRIELRPSRLALYIAMSAHERTVSGTVSWLMNNTTPILDVQ